APSHQNQAELTETTETVSTRTASTASSRNSRFFGKFEQCRDVVEEHHDAQRQY
ncbi:unnamed protein product, partial [Citrullus colocynthis]